LVTDNEPDIVVDIANNVTPHKCASGRSRQNWIEQPDSRVACRVVNFLSRVEVEDFVPVANADMVGCLRPFISQIKVTTPSFSTAW
jgi:hypothetical protein